MASSPAAAQLTERHRLAQLRLGAIGARRMLAAWPLIDPKAVDDTFERWLRVVLPLTQAQREASARLAQRYYSEFRNREVPDAPAFTPPPVTPLDTNALTGALVVTGPAALKNNVSRGMDLTRAAGLARTETARAAMRYGLEGGRTMLTGSVAADPRALGWARVASGRACAFCSMLASRGPVYSETSVGFEAHRGCGCSAEPVFNRDTAWPAGSRQYQQMWSESGASGPDALNTFRRHLASVRSPA